MRLTQNKIEEILTQILGVEGLPLIRELIGKENVSEFVLATKIKRDIKIVRKMLYLLYNHNLVGFTRKKDKQKGWYIYYWTLLPDSIRFNYYKMKRGHLATLKEQLASEEKELFFVCPNSCVRLNFDQAMDFEFHCPECGELLKQDDKELRIKELKKQIVQVEEDLSKVQLQRKVRKKKAVAAKKKVKKKVAAKRKATRKKTTKKKVKKAKKKVAKKKTTKKKKKTTKKKTSRKTDKKKAAKRKTTKGKTVKKKPSKKSTKKTSKKVTKKKAVKKK